MKKTHLETITFDVTGGTTREKKAFVLPPAYPHIKGISFYANGDYNGEVELRNTKESLIAPVHMDLVGMFPDNVAADNRFLSFNYTHAGEQYEFAITRFASVSAYTIWITFKLEEA